ncbi:MAG TPA: polyprenyl synthetase family protein [Thermoanaerobaculia bacterium]|nr:polyprenyl synthetase family protein [Thermoanaerobaculia bacterium]
MPKTLPELLAAAKRSVDARLPQLLAEGAGEADPLDALPAAAREALVSEGKRVRPALVFLSGALFSAPEARLLDPACAIEMVHAASLILDDLPSMDDATTRRGRPALHVTHGEAVAILAAVTLLSRAFGVLADAALRAGAERISGESALDAVSRLAEACGLAGLASGQALDLKTPPDAATFDRLETIHARKTGALFVASAELGAILGGARQRELAAVRSYAKNVGLAFQIVDDLLPPAVEKTGKQARRVDAPTFVRHVGEDGARRLVHELTQHAVEALGPFGGKGEHLAELALLLRDRTS